MKWLVTHVVRKQKKNADAQFSPFQCETPAYGMVLTTFRYNFPSINQTFQQKPSKIYPEVRFHCDSKSRKLSMQFNHRSCKKKTYQRISGLQKKTVLGKLDVNIYKSHYFQNP